MSQTEDIFELIKFDILYELITRHAPPLSKLDVTNIEALNFLSGRDLLRVFKSFVENVPEIGKFVTPIVKPIEELVKVIREKKTSLRENDNKDIDNFANALSTKQGSIYEFDFYTQLISQLIATVKRSESNDIRQVVLIVDDLDRIDPEHIFRILNIFAVHFDVKLHAENRNKFGIDKVIICCDIENIRKIFKNRYGMDVDFNGYIDKFYSHHIYNFDNRSLVAKIVGKVYDTIKFTCHTQKGGLLQGDFVQDILSSMVHSSTLNLRTII